MGEMADYYVERQIWREPRFDRLIPPSPPKKVFCKTCGVEIKWREIDDKWIPHEKNGKSRHYCKPEELR